MNIWSIKVHKAVAEIVFEVVFSFRRDQPAVKKNYFVFRQNPALGEDSLRLDLYHGACLFDNLVCANYRAHNRVILRY
jgi:hypothetical protein